MGSINKSHNEADGGILLFNGELILLYCDSVQCEIGGKESVKGRVYLTTHRLVMIVTPYRQNSAVKSLCAPFCAITKCNVEQPIFGANYIEATVRDENDSSKSFSFKMKFSKGGAIEFAMAMNRAVMAVGRNHQPGGMAAPPAYTPSPSEQYYQAPPTVYAPGYNCGVQMPVQQFPDQPPIGFIYASSAPPPYPGLGGNGQLPAAGAAQPPPYSQPQQQNPPQPPTSGYPSGGSYPPPSGGYPQQQQPSAGYPQQQPPAGYPQQQPPAGYPQQQPPPSGYPQQPQQQQPAAQAPPASASSNHPQMPGFYPPGDGNQSGAGYPTLPTESGPPAPAGANISSSEPPQAGWPTAPSFNPNWQQEDKK